MTKNAKNTIADADFIKENQDLLLFGTTVDFTPLFMKIGDRLGDVLCPEGAAVLLIDFPEMEVRVGRLGELYIALESENIIENCGLMRVVMKEVRIATFGTKLYYQKLDANGKVIDNDGDNKDAEAVKIRPAIWFTLNFRFKLLSGGENGCEFATVRYNEEDGWDIEFVKSSEPV